MEGTEDGTKFTGLRIIKRQTIAENYADTVYATVYLEGEKIRYARGCILHYVLYNEGWILDNTEGYMDGEWWAKPLQGPDEVLVANLFNDYNAIYDVEYDNYTDWEILNWELDMEAGKAVCYVQAYRDFPCVTTKESFALQFEFLWDYYGWADWTSTSYLSAGRTAIELDWSNLVGYHEGDHFYVEFYDYDVNTNQISISGYAETMAWYEVGGWEGTYTLVQRVDDAYVHEDDFLAILGKFWLNLGEYELGYSADALRLESGGQYLDGIYYR